jgi:cytochrome P450
MQKERTITTFVIVGIFRGLVPGPVASLADYYAPPEKRFWLFIIAEFIDFGCLFLLILCGEPRNQPQKEVNKNSGQKNFYRVVSFCLFCHRYMDTNPHSSSPPSYSSSSFDKRRHSFPPGPSSLLPNKLLRQFINDPIAVLMKIAYTYGDISHFKFGRQHVYLVNNPQYIENILIRDHKNFIKSRGLQVSKRLLGEGLVTSEGEYHDKQRRIIQPAFYPNRIENYGRIMVDYAERISERWQDKMVIDIHGEMMHITSAIIAKSVLGSNIVDIESHKVVSNALLTSMEYLNRILMPFGGLIEKIPLLPINKDFRSAKNTLDSIVYGMIKEHRDNTRIKKKPKGDKDDDVNDNKNVNPQYDQDLLYTLMKAQDQEAGIKQMSDIQLRDEVMTIFLAGHETTASALTWTFYLLSQHPDVERQMYEELCLVLRNKNNHDNNNNLNHSEGCTAALRLPTIEDIPKLDYTEKVLRESMRLYPPAWTLGRQALTDYVIDKYVIPRGSIILMSQYVMHHNARFFPNPEAFDPERWTKEFKSVLPRFSYFPFGGGIRGCVGEPFAWIEGILVLATVYRKWTMHHDPDHKVELKPLITLRPKYGMRMKLERRR